MRRKATIAGVVAVVFAGSGFAQAEPVPDVSLCAATQLQVSAVGTPAHVEFRDKQTKYFTSLNVFVTNVGTGPCYLMGAPVVTLRSAGQDVGAPYSRDRDDLSDVQVGGATEFALGPLLLPFGTSHQYAELAGSWNAPWCGKPTKAVVTVTSLAGDWQANGRVPSPPCLGPRQDAGTRTSGSSVLTAKSYRP